MPVIKLPLAKKKVGNIAILYLKRIPSALKLTLKIENTTILYSACQFLPDVLPVYILKHTKHLRCVQTLYHIIPPPTQRGGSFITNLLAFSAQKVAFTLIRSNADAIIVLNNFN